MNPEAADVVTLPAASYAFAVIDFAPSATVVVFHESSYGAEPSSPSFVAPL